MSKRIAIFTVFVLFIILSYSFITILVDYLQIEEDRKKYGTIYVTDENQVDYLLLEDNYKLSKIEELGCCSSTLVGNKYYTLCHRGNSTFLHKIDLNNDFSGIIGIEEIHELPIIYKWQYCYLASNGSYFWTLERILKLSGNTAI